MTNPVPDNSEPKWIVKSKTFLTALLAPPVAAGSAWLLTKTGFDLDAKEQAAIVAGATAVVMGGLQIIMRRLSKQAVTFLKPPA